MSKLTWKVLYHNINTKEIEYYDIFKGGWLEKVAREIMNTASNFEEWKESFQKKLMYQFWSRAEYEIIVTSWPSSISAEELDRMNQEIKNHYKTSKLININLSVAEKIDIYSQIMANWEPFTYYVWNFIHGEEVD